MKTKFKDKIYKRKLNNKLEFVKSLDEVIFDIKSRIEFDKDYLKNDDLCYPFRFCYEFDILVCNFWLEVLKK